MFNRIMFLLLGVCLALYGFFTIIQRGYYSSRFEFYFDFGPYHYIFGIFVAVVGVFFVYTSLTSKKKKFLICPECKKSFNPKDVPNSYCPKCSIGLEDLDGFYDRHPELKEKGQDDM
jgi:hypothetical protein